MFVSLFVRGLIRTSLLTFGSMYFMFRLNSRFGLIVLCAFPFLVGCIAFCLWRANPLFSRLQAQLDSINAILQEDVSGIRVIKACVRESYEKLRFGKANGELIRTQLKTLVIFAFMNPVVNALMYFVVAILLSAGYREVESGSATPGTVMAAITYTTQLLNGILMLVMLFQNISRGIPSWKRVKEVLESVPELSDGSFDGKTEVQGEIEFRDASFAYPGSSQNVLSHIDLTIRKGETVAVMGATGCGKTSLVNLIPRFYDVTEGAVFVDGIDRIFSSALWETAPSGAMSAVFQQFRAAERSRKFPVWHSWTHKKAHRNIDVLFVCIMSVMLRCSLCDQLSLSYYRNVGSTDLAAVLRITLGIESNLLALFEGLETISVDCGEMYEYFFAGCIVGDETITLLCIKPLNCTVVHFGTSFIIKGHYARFYLIILKRRTKKSHIFVNHHQSCNDLQKYVSSMTFI